MQAMMDGDMAESLYITRNDDPDGEPVALMLAYIVPCPFSGETQVWEQAWFVTAGERGQPHAFTLLAALEELAAELGCRHVWMAHLDNKFGERLRHILPRFGYKPHQIYYSKEPQPWVLVQSQGPSSAASCRVERKSGRLAKTVGSKRPRLRFKKSRSSWALRGSIKASGLPRTACLA